MSFMGISDWRAKKQKNPEQDQEMPAEQDQSGRFGSGPGQNDPSVSTSPVTMGPDGQPLPPQAPARAESALGRVFGQGGAGMFGQMISQAVGEALGESAEHSVRRATEEALGPFGGRTLGRMAGRTAGRVLGGALGQAGEAVLGQRGGQSYGLPGQPGQPGYGPPGAQPFDQSGQQPFNQPGQQPFNQPAQPPAAPPGGAAFGQQASGFPQVSWDDAHAPAAGQPATPSGGSDPAGAAQFFASGAGEHASAVVTGVQEVPPGPGFAPPGGVADVMLEITRADGSVYNAPIRLSFAAPEHRAAIAVPGTQLRVRIDPSSPTRVAIVS